MTDFPQEQAAPVDEFGIEAVREVLRLISETDVTEIQIERGNAKLHIKRGQPNAQLPLMITPGLTQQVMPHAAPPPPVAAMPFGHQLPAAGPAEYELAPGSQLIVSPMVGTFYISPSPKDPPYVSEGDQVQVGDVVGIVEAMKIMNEIDSEVAGRVSHIFVKTGQPVEYGQKLMVVEPI